MWILSVLSPPVDIDKFRNANLSCHTSYDKKQNMVLVVSRFSADKEIENAITLANLLKDKCLNVAETFTDKSDLIKFIAADLLFLVIVNSKPVIIALGMSPIGGIVRIGHTILECHK